MSDLRSQKNTNNSHPHGGTGSLDELPGGRKLRRLRPVHLEQRFCQEFRYFDRFEQRLNKDQKPGPEVC